jgi:hypothetical protein
MKKLYSIVFLISLFYTANAKTWIAYTSDTPRPALIELLSSDLQTTVLKASIPGFYKTEVTTPRGTATTLSLEDASRILEAGAPDLIKLSTSVIIPDMSKMKVEIISSSHIDFPDYEVAPSKGSLLRSINPADVPFTYGPSYSQNTFYPGKLAALQSPYLLRDYRGQALWIYPFQYNPVSKVLRLYTEMTIKISEESADGENVFIRNRSLSAIDNDFHQVYANHFLNYNQTRAYTPVEETGSMLIISYASFMNTMQPLIDWKIKRGLPVEMVSVTTAGSTASAIKTYIANYYNTHNLKYVLLVGDAAQIPSLTASGGASDPSYGYITGGDSYPEVFVGRFSGTNTTDIQTQVTRSINYERYPEAAGTWYSKTVGIASNQGPGDDNEYDWEHERNIRTRLLTFTYNDIAELYDGSQGGMDEDGNPNSSDFVSTVNNGISLVNYTGHGSQTAFVTTGFSTSNMSSLTNANKLPFVISVGCVNGDFTSGTCLGESFLRSQNGGQPTGAIATFMSSINQYWDEPMRAQDEMTDLLIGTYPTNIKRTLGGIAENGCMNMNDVYGSSGYDMTDTWHIFGDPSVCIRTATPTAITALHETSVFTGATSLSVACNTEGALISLTVNNQIIGTGIVSGGNVVINFPALTTEDTLFVTATAFNAIPYEGFVAVTFPVTIPDYSASLSGFNILPNPAHENALVQFHSDVTASYTLKVFNSLGQQVMSVMNHFPAGENSVAVNTSEFSKGIYYLKLENNNTLFVRKLVIE